MIFFLFVFSQSFYMILIRWFILWFLSSLPHRTGFASVISIKLSNQTSQIFFIQLILPNSFHHTLSTIYGKNTWLWWSSVRNDWQYNEKFLWDYNMGRFFSYDTKAKTKPHILILVQQALLGNLAFWFTYQELTKTKT